MTTINPEASSVRDIVVSLSVLALTLGRSGIRMMSAGPAFCIKCIEGLARKFFEELLYGCGER
jgi:hypothetical protein